MLPRFINFKISEWHIGIYCSRSIIHHFKGVTIITDVTFSHHLVDLLAARQSQSYRTDHAPVVDEAEGERRE